jgi:hypothetical protein
MFIKEVFSSSDNLQLYLFNESEKVLESAKNPPVTSTISNSQIHLTFMKIKSYAYQYFNSLFTYFGYTNYAKYCGLQSARCFQASVLKNHPDLLISTINAQQPKNQIYSAQPLRLRIGGSIEGMDIGGQIQFNNFYNIKGVCSEMCSWFIYLYFKTAENFQNPLEQMKFIGSYFKDGAPKAAELLQSLPSHREFCNYLLNFKQNENDIKVENPFLANISNEIELLRKLLGSMETGIYRIVIHYCHDILFIKLDANLSVIFDPNIGLIQVHKLNNYQHLLDMFKKYTCFVNESNPNFDKVRIEDLLFQKVEPFDYATSNTKFTLKIL